MGFLRLITGNRLEILADELAGLLLPPLSSPFEPEIVVVQSKGMEHWISMQLAEKHGVCSNIRFPFPNRFLEEIHARVMPGSEPGSEFDPAELSWRIMRLIPSLIDRPEFREVRSYIAGDTHGIRRLQLCRRIADTFDQYLVFRPDLIFSWEKGRGSGWQPVLWRELVREIGQGSHRAARAKGLMQRLDSAQTADLLPERVSVFGISALPRFHMEILAGISRFTQVFLFLMNPCMEYWADIAAAREIVRRTARDPEPPGPEELHLEAGNPLLASMGGMGRDFLSLVLDYPSETLEHFEDPGRETLLRTLQSDILRLRDRTADKEKPLLRREDSSIQIHVCHSRLREVEVLRDRLLELFEREPGLLPGDVLVAMPDIEAYAPYIRAVFDTPDDRELRIPYTVADRSARRESELIEAFLNILDLPDERCSLSGVLSILESGPVMRRFGLSESDLDRIREWLVEAGIRWGLDAESRAGLNLPPFEEGTWRFGLKRLILGYAMWGGGEKTFAGILPYEKPGAAEADLLERFLEFAEALLDSIPRLERPMPASDWEKELTATLKRLMEPGEAARSEILILQRALRELGRAGDPDGPNFKEDLSPAAVRSFLSERLDREAMGFGFMTGGVTFCAMVPMRSIPFRVICCLGLDGDSFPRAHRSPGFDLIAGHPRPGDRSRRSDDRYLFLETILSARDYLHLSYVGKSQRDNSPI
ncbi:MAG: exodeoxyribonuclease V subunit gamma, partial [Desulfobacteraceae bacterium]